VRTPSAKHLKRGNIPHGTSGADLLICVTVRLNMHAGPDAPPYEHPLITGENAAADLFADLFLR
jgi:hypothetical protein